MSKIDTYNKIKSENGKDIGYLNRTLQNKEDGTKDPDNDKGGFHFYNQRIWDSDMTVYIHASYGFYGSSSAYSVGGENIKKYVLQVLNGKAKEIVEEAIKLMAKDIEKAKKECADEAKAILESI